MNFLKESTLEDIAFVLLCRKKQLVYLDASYRMWLSLYEMCKKNKNVRRVYKSDFFDTIKGLVPRNRCYLCECCVTFEPVDEGFSKCGKGCPMFGKFGGSGTGHCMDEDSYYVRWSQVPFTDQAEYAWYMCDAHVSAINELNLEIEVLSSFLSRYEWSDNSYIAPIEFIPKRDVQAEFKEASRKSIDDAIALWQWVVQETLAQGRRVEKSEYYREHPELPRPNCACPFCEVKEEFKGLIGDPEEESNCRRACPGWGILWGVNSERGCLGSESSYSAWHYGESYETSLKQASRFVTELLELKLQFDKK